MASVVTFGEAMVLFTPMENGPLRHIDLFRKYVAGAELNVAIGLARLGESAGWVSRLGDDEFGAIVLAALRAEGVDVSHVRIDPEAPTAVFFKERRGLGETRVYYYRKGSAASRMEFTDLSPNYLAGAKYLHVTGITPALSDSCLVLTHAAVQMARAAGVKVCFDPNIRLKLLGGRVQEVLLPLLRSSDVALLGLEEARMLLGEGSAEELARAAQALGPATVVIKLGAEGALGLEGQELVRVPGFPVKVADTVGAGDGFSAGFLAGRLKGWSLTESVRLGNLVGACAITVVGDYAGYPTLREALGLLGLESAVIER